MLLCLYFQKPQNTRSKLPQLGHQDKWSTLVFLVLLSVTPKEKIPLYFKIQYSRTSYANVGQKFLSKLKIIHLALLCDSMPFILISFIFFIKFIHLDIHCLICCIRFLLWSAPSMDHSVNTPHELTSQKLPYLPFYLMSLPDFLLQP